MLISVRFGSGQQRIFNTECQTAPLLDAINEGCYADMASFLKKREDVIHKELTQWKKKEASLQKKLEKLEPKSDEPGGRDSKPRKGVKIKRKTAKKKKATEEEEKKEEAPAPAEEAKQEVKEETKPKGKKGKEEPPKEEEKKEETEEEKKARELNEVRQSIEQNKQTQARI
jgi:hypothetical protein